MRNVLTPLLAALAVSLLVASAARAEDGGGAPDARDGDVADEPPAADRDHDGVSDGEDPCADVPAGLNPDPFKSGCPAPDGDGDSVVDASDACPDKAGAPDADPAKNGCPGKVLVSRCRIELLEPVVFVEDKDAIRWRSYPLLEGVAAALLLMPQIKRIAVEVHTDGGGPRAHDLELSERRAQSIAKWLAARGAVEPGRIEFRGYGPDRPIAENKTAAGKAKNRRVELRIVDSPCEEPAKLVPSPVAAKPDAAAKPGKPVKAGKGKAGKRGKAKGVKRGKRR